MLTFHPWAYVAQCSLQAVIRFTIKRYAKIYQPMGKPLWQKTLNPNLPDRACDGKLSFPNLDLMKVCAADIP